MTGRSLKADKKLMLASRKDRIQEALQLMAPLLEAPGRRGIVEKFKSAVRFSENTDIQSRLPYLSASFRATGPDRVECVYAVCSYVIQLFDLLNRKQDGTEAETLKEMDLWLGRLEHIAVTGFTGLHVYGNTQEGYLLWKVLPDVE